jgi:hypothetical protein
MELHGFSFELCIGMGMAACIDEGRWRREDRIKMASRRREDRIRMTRKIFGGKLLEEDNGLRGEGRVAI